MIPGLESTPPEVALALGFFIALALERKDERKLIAKFLPIEDETPAEEEENQFDFDHNK